jgi:hypothetical protein
MVILAACGGEGGPSSPPAAALSGTLAYVVSECRDTKEGYFFRQSLQIRQGDGEPITVMQVPEVGPIPVGGLCKFISQIRYGPNSPRFGAVQRLAVGPDGTTVAFELADDFSIVARNFLAAELKGIFVVRADGSGLRRLGPPSRQASFVNSPGWFRNDLSFSPDGRTLTFPDLGPGPDGTEASQIFLQDVATGARAQITHLPTATPAADLPRGHPSAWLPRFLDDETVAFYTDTDIDGANPQGEAVAATVKRDGSSLKGLPQVALPGSQINPTFIITGDRPEAVPVFLPGEPVNHSPTCGLTFIFEVFLDDGDNVLQLTNFHRGDTGTNGAFVGVDRATVFFEASADPFGENPSQNCELFSIDRLGANLRQLTSFHETDHSARGCCFGAVGSGCAVQPVNVLGLGQDVRTQTLLFYSSCDPLGTNPNGGQIFAMRPDGADLRQLTNARGLVTEAGGTVIGELPGPFAFSSGPP